MEKIQQILSRCPLPIGQTKQQGFEILMKSGDELKTISLSELARAVGTRIGVADTNPQRIEENLQPLRPLLQKICEQYEVPEALIYAILINESGGNPNAISPAGALGAMQLNRDIYAPDPKRQYFKTPVNPFRVNEALDRGVHFVAYLKRLYRGDWERVIVAYNQGENRVNRALKNQHVLGQPWLKFINAEGKRYLTDIQKILQGIDYRLSQTTWSWLRAALPLTGNRESPPHAKGL